jgi:hypothetical protein
VLKLIRAALAALIIGFVKMGLFSSIGKIAGSFLGGPTGSAIGGAIGGALDTKGDRSYASSVSDLSYGRQKEFAQKSIQWKVADAKKAGLHPLAVLGSTTTPYTPSGQTVTGSVQGDVLAEMRNAKRDKRASEMLEESHFLDMRNKSADFVLKMAQASSLAKDKIDSNIKRDETQVRDMYIKAVDNNPKSPTYKQQIWVVDPELAESGEGLMNMLSTGYANIVGGRPNSKPPRKTIYTKQGKKKKLTRRGYR